MQLGEQPRRPVLVLLMLRTTRLLALLCPITLRQAHSAGESQPQRGQHERLSDPITHKETLAQKHTGRLRSKWTARSYNCLWCFASSLGQGPSYAAARGLSILLSDSYAHLLLSSTKGRRLKAEHALQHTSHGRHARQPKECGPRHDEQEPSWWAVLHTQHSVR